jgi:hypothetical protein
MFSDATAYSLQQSRNYKVPNIAINSSRGVTFSMILEPLVVVPTSGNISVEVEVVARFSHKLSPLFHIEAEYPWRKPRVTFFVPNKPIHCQVDERLRTNRLYALTTQIIYDDNHLSVYVFLDGILKNRCMEYVTSNPFVRNETVSGVFAPGESNELTFWLDDTPKNRFVNTIEAIYWPRALTYSEIQFVGSSHIILNSDEGMALAAKGPDLSAHSWYQQARLRHEQAGMAPVPLQEQECAAADAGVDGTCNTATAPALSTVVTAPLDSNVGVMLWPHFYSEKIVSASPAWYRDHLLESVRHAVDATRAALRGNGRMDIFLPLTAAHKEQLLSPLRDLQLALSSEQLGVAIFLCDNRAAPLSGRGPSAIYSFAAVANEAVSDMLRGVAVPVVEGTVHERLDHVAFLSSQVLPELGWLSALLQAEAESSTSAERRCVVGAKLVSLSGELLHFGYEMFELPYTGGTEVLLTPHDRYR